MFRGGGELPASPTPRILILSCETKKLSSLSPFQRKEGCDRFGKVTRCDKLRDGGIEVEFLDEKDAKKALSATEFTYSVKDGQGRRLVKLPIAVSAHRTKNFSRGMIYCVDLEDVSDDEIADGLSDFGVVMARRIKSRNKRTGTLEPTHNIILTFNQMDLPREVTVGYVRVKVRTYFPSPMRCFRCLRFGHTRDHCRNRPTCSKCAATDHTGEACTEGSRKCVNCAAPHSAFDKDCPAFLREKEIIAIKVTERVSFREARERFNASHPKRSYPTVARETFPAQAGPAHPRGNQQQNLHQLISLLQSFGLQLVAGPGASSGPAASAPPPVTAPLATATTQTSPTSREGPSEGGWIRVGSRRGSAPRSAVTSHAGSETSSPPSPPTPSRAPGSAAMEALRRGEEERRAREARRARAMEKAREAGQPRAEVAPAPVPPAPQGPQPPKTPPTGGSPPMGPPPPPPPIRRPPPPPPGAVNEAQPPSVPAPQAPKQAAPPVATERPAKRTLPQEGSPTEGGTPRARQRVQPGSTGGRSHSADGRQRRGHARIQFGGSPWSGAAEYF